MKIGVLELLSDDAGRSWCRMPHDIFVAKQQASIMPQAVSVWCRNMGHEVFYATYYRQSDPIRLIPDDLDVIFISCFSRSSGLAYALSRALKKAAPGILTVLGGPHAKQFSRDASRFFDVVIKECDQTLIREVLSDLPRNVILTSPRRLKSLPGIEERLPEIRKASFWKSRPNRFCFIPVLSSTGCPYSCDFCVDWNSPYHPFPLDQVEADLKFAATHFPQVRINFYDPNFGVNFDRVMSVIETVSHPKKRWFLTEGSLDSLTRDRLVRMERAGCLCVIPGIETWTAYSRKAGVRNCRSAREKLDQVVERFELIRHHIPIIQANLIFGLDADKGEAPVRLTREFIQRTPYVSHSLNIPAPFGETPLFRTYLKKNRILSALPFTFYCKPYLATTLKHYSPVEFYAHLIDIFSQMTSAAAQMRAVRTTENWLFKGYHLTRNQSLHFMIRRMRKILHLLKTDAAFRAFHEGRSHVLPRIYHTWYDDLMGPYKELVPHRDRTPVFDSGE